MKYFMDTEFLEGTQKQNPFKYITGTLCIISIIYAILSFMEGNIALGVFDTVLFIVYGYLFTLNTDTKPTIDLISIGIISEDNREYYAIDKDFNLKEAWNRYDRVEQTMFEKQNNFKGKKVYWIRDNVLKPIFIELLAIEKPFVNSLYSHPESKIIVQKEIDKLFTYKKLKRLINKYGKSNKEIAKDIIKFAQGDPVERNNPIFYTYYGAYDWVVFCWLFGKMIDLPKGFPMYCNDLKQELDNKANNLNWLYLRDTWNNSRMSIYTIGKGDSQKKDRLATLEEKLKRIKELDEYPKQTNEHNALADARWNYELYKFLNTI